MICRWSPQSQYRRSDCHLAIVDCSFFRYTNDDLRNHTNKRRKHKAWTREDNQITLHFYFRSNPTQRGYRKRMIEVHDGGARGAMVIVAGYGHGDTSSNPGPDLLHFTEH